MKVLTNSTPIALWQNIVQDAESKCSITLQEDIESYLVFLLMRFSKRPDVVKQIIALDYLNSFSLAPAERLIALKEVGDKCLLFSGLFPHIAEKRLIKISYLVKMGQSAYTATSDALFESLANQFVPLMDVLQTLQVYANLSPIEAYDLWNETHSQRALTILRGYTRNL